MTCHLVALDKCPGENLISIEETLCQDFNKIFLRASREKSSMACGNIQLCAGCKAGIEVETNAVVKQRQERGWVEGVENWAEEILEVILARAEVEYN